MAKKKKSAEGSAPTEGVKPPEANGARVERIRALLWDKVEDQLNNAEGIALSTTMRLAFDMLKLEKPESDAPAQMPALRIIRVQKPITAASGT